MVMCSICKKHPAVIFVTRMDGSEPKNEGLCLRCAKELKLPNVDNIMQQLGITEDDIDTIADQMEDVMDQLGDENFIPGGAPSMEFMNSLMNKMGGMTPDQGVDPSESLVESRTPPKDKNKKSRPQKNNLRFLNQFCMNLTEKARNGQLDEVIGRDQEMKRVLQILNRRSKNNPCLIGEPGVGKTAIAEGIALKIVRNEVPAKIACKEVYLLDLTALVAGTQFRGQFESRVKGLLEEIKSVGNVILVIDEVHNLVGTGDSEGTMSAANMLKPALSRGEIQVIGATTLTEYRKYIEKDAALERRFQPVIVNEPSIADTIEILRGVKGYYESYHNIHIPMMIVQKAVELSERYVNDRYLPDKAIDLLDETCSNAVLRTPVYNDLFVCRTELDNTRRAIAEIENKEEKTDKDYEDIATFKASEYRLEEKEKEYSAQVEQCAVTLDDLATVIELWTGIPASSIKASESEKLRNLESSLSKRIVGQDKAIRAVSDAVRRARLSIIPRTRPVSFIFTGPTGVGKTELVKVLSRELFDSPETLIRLDMSEFMEKHSVSRIIGSPPGYVGYDEAGQLTEKIRRKPYSVILFDEIEKAHPDVLNILLQVLDDGRITDAHGKSVSFEHTVIIMTSNAGSNIKGGAAGFNKSAEMLSSEKTRKALNDFLRPEFINRVDEIITFDPLPKEVFPQIVQIFLSDLAKGLEEKEIAFSYTSEAVQMLADESYSAEYGARNVRRIVQNRIEDQIVRDIYDNESVPSEVLVSVQDGQLKVEVK